MPGKITIVSFFSFGNAIGRVHSISISYFLTAFLVVAVLSCKEIYHPKTISSPQFYIVVEGVLNVSGPASVSISRTTTLDNSNFVGEPGAQVTVEGKDNTTRSMQSNGFGIYTSPDLNLHLDNEYRLRIRTSNGKEYLSEYVKARDTPAIDSITWKQEDNGLRLFVNTHDASGNTRYYRWQYDETWEVHSYYDVHLIYISDSNIVRSNFPWEDVSVGWKFDFSNSILLGSSAQLSSDIIGRAPVNFVASGDEKFGVRYSILVRQYALDKTGYAFYELMKKNTEQLGTIFDAQPSEIKGNIRCINDAEEQVIGYISASTITEKRIFVTNHELVIWPFRQNCPTINVRNDPDSIRAVFQAGFLPWKLEGDYYISSFDRCIDVTARGATLVKPSYW
jgi:hypothetical protein